MSNIVLNTTEAENRERIRLILQDHLIVDDDDDPDLIEKQVAKLASDYVVVENIGDLLTGRYVRWIRDGVLTRGGIVLGVDDDEDKVLCKTTNHILCRFSFVDCPCFMKLNQMEKWFFHG